MNRGDGERVTRGGGFGGSCRGKDCQAVTVTPSCENREVMTAARDRRRAAGVCVRLGPGRDSAARDQCAVGELRRDRADGRSSQDVARPARRGQRRMGASRIPQRRRAPRRGRRHVRSRGAADARDVQERRGAAGDRGGAARR